MRFMIIVKATAATEAGAMPESALLAEMAAYHEQLAQAGVLLDAIGLQPSAKGWRIHYAADGGKPSVTDGPFAETKELIGGYTLIQVRSREEALEWTRRFPAPHRGIACHVEVRQLFELEDFQQDAAIDRLRQIGVGDGQ